jgi:hypothetical protein
MVKSEGELGQIQSMQAQDMSDKEQLKMMAKSKTEKNASVSGGELISEIR